MFTPYVSRNTRPKREKQPMPEFEGLFGPAPEKIDLLDDPWGARLSTDDLPHKADGVTHRGATPSTLTQTDGYRPRHRRTVRWPDATPETRCPQFRDPAQPVSRLCSTSMCPRHDPTGYAEYMARHATDSMARHAIVVIQ